MAYFDNASTTFPKPEEVYDYMDSFYRRCGASVGRGKYALAQNTGNMVAETRQAIQTLLHCPNKQVIFTPTETIAMNIVISGVLETGVKNIYISPFEHNAVTRTLHHFAESRGLHVFQLAVTEKLAFDLEGIEAQFRENAPDFVIVCHASNVIGLIAPIEDIFPLAKKYHAVTLTDMAQTAGLVDCNIGSDDIDFAVFAGHKTMYGPTGASGFVMKPDFQLPATIFGGTGYDSANQDMPENLPERFEMGTLNTAGLAGLHAALEWGQRLSIQAIWDREMEHRQRLLDILGEYDFVRFIGNEPDRRYAGIVSCLFDGLSVERAGTLLEEHGIAVRTGLQCAPMAHQFLGTYPEGTIRFGVGYFTTDDDFNALRAALDNIRETL